MRRWIARQRRRWALRYERFNLLSGIKWAREDINECHRHPNNRDEMREANLAAYIKSATRRIGAINEELHRG